MKVDISWVIELLTPWVDRCAARYVKIHVNEVIAQTV